MLCKKNRPYVLLAAGLLLSAVARAEGPPQVSSLSNPFVWIMIGLIVLLLIVIRSLAGILLNSARNPGQRQPEETGTTKTIPSAILLAVTLLAVTPVMAGESADLTPADRLTPPLINGLTDSAFYLMVSVIGVEILVILYLLYNVNMLLKADSVKAAAAAGSPNFRPAFSFPPWWKFGFYLMMVFVAVYVWHYHESHSTPREPEKYQEDYPKATANVVNENTVTLLAAPADLEAGKAIFQTTCFACHGKNGEGMVGPNLTDAYWLHGGSVREIFKTITDGWPDKGMKSWKDDYSPLQIAQIAGFVKSLAGTNPPNPKAPEGTLVR